MTENGILPWRLLAICITAKITTGPQHALEVNDDPQTHGELLRDALPERTWHNRLQRDGTGAFMEFGAIRRRSPARLGIEVDRLGRAGRLHVGREKSPLEVGGYLVVDNLAMGRPSMGGIRMLPDLTPSSSTTWRAA